MNIREQTYIFRTVVWEVSLFCGLPCRIQEQICFYYDIPVVGKSKYVFIMTCSLFMDLLTLYSVHCAVNDKIKGLIILNTDNVDKG